MVTLALLRKNAQSLHVLLCTYTYPVFASILKSYNNSVKMSVEHLHRVNQSCETLYILPRSWWFLFSYPEKVEEYIFQHLTRLDTF